MALAYHRLEDLRQTLGMARVGTGAVKHARPRDYVVFDAQTCRRLGLTVSQWHCDRPRNSAAFLGDEARLLSKIEYIKGRDGSELVLYHFGTSKVVRDLTRENALHPLASAFVPPMDARRDVLSPEQASSNGDISIEEELRDADIETDFHGWVKQHRSLCHVVYKMLPLDEQHRLRDVARANVAQMWWDRVEEPESPMSLGLWELVAQHYKGQVTALVHHPEETQSE